MKLYATTRWVGVYQELSSLIPYEKILNILEIEGKWGLKFPNGFWKVLRDVQSCLEPIHWATIEFQSVILIDFCELIPI